MGQRAATQQPPVVCAPSKCSAAEIEAFVKLASAGREVQESNIERGVRRAKYLLWIDDGDIAPCAVAALKNPFPSYRRGIFEKARSPLQAADFPLEFGYAVTDKRCRRRGHGRSLMRKALELAQVQGVYATVRLDNKGMQKILEDHGFKRSGGEYGSTNRDAALVLFVKAGMSK